MEQAEVIAAVEGMYVESDRVVHDILSRIMQASGVHTTQRMASVTHFERPVSRFWATAA